MILPISCLSLLKKRDEEPIWNLAVAKLMATWFSFGFRVYGEMVSGKFRDKLIESNAAVNQALLRGQLECQIDTRGRLIVTHEKATSRALDLDSDGFKETIMLKPDDALSVVFSPSSSNVLYEMGKRANHWDLLTPSIQTGNTNPLKMPPEPAVHEPFPTSTLRENGSVKGTKTPDKKSVKPRESISTPCTTDANGERPTDPMGICFKVGKTLDLFREEWQEFFPGNTALTQLNIGNSRKSRHGEKPS